MIKTAEYDATQEIEVARRADLFDELVEALKNLIRWGEVLGPKPDSGDWIALDKARAALAKAKEVKP